jgi:hypothetical protein
MKTCPFCAEDIQDAAIVCKHCGREVPSAPVVATAPRRSLGSRIGIGVLIGVLGLIGLSMLGSLIGHARPAAVDPAQGQALSDFVEQATTAGLIHSLNANGHTVQVNPIAWAYFDADTKKHFAGMLASYCDLHSTYRGQFLDVVDAQSGKKIAEYGALGFTVY